MCNQLKTRIQNNKEQIFCEWRRRYVRLTPEEWVRQNFLHRLVGDFLYPAGLIGVEVPIEVGDAHKRCDAIVYDLHARPVVLIEFKADTVPLTQRTLDQAVTYNRRLQVPYLILHNGPQTIVVQVGDEVRYLPTIPAWETVLATHLESNEK